MRRISFHTKLGAVINFVANARHLHKNTFIIALAILATHIVFFVWREHVGEAILALELRHEDLLVVAEGATVFFIEVSCFLIYEKV